MNYQRCVYRKGRGLGGSSIIDHLIYTRGNKYDFDQWAELGNDGWSYKDLLPYFRKVERASLGEFSNSVYHNGDGLVSVEFSQKRSPLVEYYLEAARELNHDIIDYNGESQIGTGYAQTNTVNGKRNTDANAYLLPIYKQRKNLHILPDALVTKIVIDPKTKTATGVNFKRNNQNFTIHAIKEIILSAGTFNSPQLLMLSGVGPKEQLEDLGLGVIVDLPVGSTMSDHMGVFGPVFKLNTTRSSRKTRDIGLLNLASGIEALSFHKTPLSLFPSTYPDYEMIFIGNSPSFGFEDSLLHEANIRQDIYDTVFRPIELEDVDSWTVGVMHTRPASKGKLLLRDDSIHSSPIISYSYLSEEQDIDTILQGIAEALRFGNSQTMQRLGAQQHVTPIPDCAMHLFNSEIYWRCAIKTTGFSMNNQVSTVKMGPRTDPEAVVDSKLRVYDVKNLRVGDVSVLPTQIAGHPHAISYVIGEKLSDMLKLDWLAQKQLEKSKLKSNLKMLKKEIEMFVVNIDQQVKGLENRVGQKGFKSNNTSTTVARDAEEIDALNKDPIKVGKQSTAEVKSRVVENKNMPLKQISYSEKYPITLTRNYDSGCRDCTSSRKESEIERNNEESQQKLYLEIKVSTSPNSKAQVFRGLLSRVEESSDESDGLFEDKSPGNTMEGGIINETSGRKLHSSLESTSEDNSPEDRMTPLLRRPGSRIHGSTTTNNGEKHRHEGNKDIWAGISPQKSVQSTQIHHSRPPIYRKPHPPYAFSTPIVQPNKSWIPSFRNLESRIDETYKK